MANRWERGKLGPYTLPQDFTSGGVALAGINNTKPQVSKLLVPTATLFYSTNFTPVENNSDLYLVPSGQAIGRTQYSELFNVVGTNFGTGDGSTTFNLPNVGGVEARAEGTSAASGVFQFQTSTLPDHTHTTVALGPGENPSYDGPINYNFPTYPGGFFGLSGPLNTTQRGNNLDKQSILAAKNYYSNWNDAGVTPKHRYYLAPFYTTKTTELPLGAVIPFIGSDDLSPFGSNWLLCTGQTIPASTYPNAAALGLTLTPDLRGRFVSALGNKQRPFGVSTAAAPTVMQTPIHRHLLTPSTTSNCYITPTLASGNYNYHFTPGGGGSGANGSVFATATTTTYTLGPGTETRPINMAVNFFMRVA